jgi:hypothetical protein
MIYHKAVPPIPKPKLSSIESIKLVIVLFTRAVTLGAVPFGYVIVPLE